MLSLTKVIKEITQGNVAPLYLFTGEQSFLIKAAIQGLREQILADEDDFNFHKFDLTETPIQLVIEAAESTPFFGDKQLIVAHHATFLGTGRAKDDVEHDVEALEAYIKNPAPFTVLVLVSNEKLDQRKRLVRLLKKEAVIAEAAPLKQGELLTWLNEQADQRQVHLLQEASVLLHQFVGHDLLMLTQELDKMATYVGKGGTITEDVVRQLAAQTVEQDVFQLVDDIAHLRIDRALSGLDHLLLRNEEPIKILFLIARQLRLMLRAKKLAEEGKPENQLGRLMGVHPYVAKLALRQSKRFTLSQLMVHLDRLADLDYQIKTGQVDRSLALKTFILQFSHHQGQPMLERPPVK